MSQFPGNAHGPWKREVNTQFCEPVSKRSRSVKIKAGDYFNRRHTCHMSRIEMVNPTSILAEMGRFGIGSRYSISINASHRVWNCPWEAVCSSNSTSKLGMPASSSMDLR
jgi:hypothetical protein